MALIPTLKAWLEAAENYATDTRSNSGSPTNGSSSDTNKKRNRTAISLVEKRVLEKNFAIEPRPSRLQIIELAKSLDVDHKIVRVWFCNRRQKEKQIKNRDDDNDSK